MVADLLRPPPPLDLEATAYQDWLHLCVFDHGRDTIGLVNVSLQGPPENDRSRATGLGLFHGARGGWLGNLEVLPAAEAAVGASSIALRQVAVSADPWSEILSASVRQQDDQLVASLSARPTSQPFRIDQRVPLGQGWISWYGVPRLALEGELRMGRRSHQLSGASAYYDHNWGRWRWGDDFGWEWGCFHAAGAGPSFVFSRTCDRAHRHFGEAVLRVIGEGQNRTFRGPGVRADCTEHLTEARPRRLPGAMAALHQARARPRLPAEVLLEAGDGLDSVRVRFSAQAAAQLITADPFVRGYGFIHEIAGVFRAEGAIAGVELEAEGLAIFEYVT